MHGDSGRDQKEEGMKRKLSAGFVLAMLMLGASSLSVVPVTAGEEDGCCVVSNPYHCVADGKKCCESDSCILFSGVCKTSCSEEGRP
jgi:hypothetical protein